MAAGAPAGLASRPRGLLASASHSGRGLVPPRAPGRRQLSPPLSPPPRLRPLPPHRALNHPSPLPQKPPQAARPRRAHPRGCEPPAAPRLCVASTASRPRAAQAAARRPGAAEEGRPAEPSARRRARRAAGEKLRGAPARAPQLCTPDSGGGNCGGGDGRWRRGRLRGGCSNSIYPPLPPLSPPPRHVDAAHWPRAPSAARAARPRPLPRRPPARAPRAHAAGRPRPLPRAAPSNPDRDRARARVCAQAAFAAGLCWLRPGRAECELGFSRPWLSRVVRARE